MSSLLTDLLAVRLTLSEYRIFLASIFYSELGHTIEVSRGSLLVKR